MSNWREAFGPSTDRLGEDFRPLGRNEVLALIEEATRFRTGIGYDVHRFAEGRKLILAGVEVPYERGLIGHSDADVVTHAAMDAALGASGCFDIGTYFPDDDPAFEGADSLKLARRAMAVIEEAGFRLEGLDITIVAEAPKMKPHIPAMKKKLSETFAVPESRLGLKATTNEKMGWIGRGEGIACIASALVREIPKFPESPT